MANKKLKLLYLARYLQEETDERHPKTVQEMIAYLERCGISAERKSIYDDLELLELYGMDVQSVRGKSYGYFLGERAFQLPELKLLIDVVQASPFLTQSKSMELIAKLEKLTSRPNGRQLRRQVYVMDRVRTHNERLYYRRAARRTGVTARCTRPTRWLSAWTGTIISLPTTQASAITATTGWIAWNPSPSPTRPATRCRSISIWGSMSGRSSICTAGARRRYSCALTGS